MKRIFIALAFAIIAMPAHAQAQRVWIAEFSTVRVEAAAPIATLPASVLQAALDISGGGAKRSAVFSATTAYIRVVCEVQCAIASASIATTSSILLPALRPEYFRVTAGSAITVIAAP